MNQTEKKKKAILEVTFALLNEKEINNITVDEIAEKAIVSKVTIFKYYKNKNHLMNIVIMRAFEHMAKEIEEVIKSNLNFEETYEAITRMKISQHEKYSSIFVGTLMLHCMQEPELLDPDAINAAKGVYHEVFEKGQSEGEIDSNLVYVDVMCVIDVVHGGMNSVSADTVFHRADFITRFCGN